MTDQTLELLCFRVGDRVFAVDIMGIREILREHALTPVPGAPPDVSGVLNLRGELVPVVNLHRALLQSESAAAGGDKKLVVVKAGGRTAGILVDQVLEVVSLELRELSPVPGITADGRGAIVAAFRRELDGEGLNVVLVIRLGALLREAGVELNGGEA